MRISDSLRTMRIASAAVAVGAAASTAGASGELCFNIDFGNPGSTPSDAYGAAGTAGYWNDVGVPSAAPMQLRDATGALSTVTIRNIGGTQILATDDAATAGDDEALMDDMLIGFNDPIDLCLWIGNVPAGTYEVLIYAMTPGDAGLLSRTRVDFADQGPTMVGGAWPGGHQEGVTYSRFTVTVGSEIGLHSGLLGGFIQSGVNAIQIRPVPDCGGDVNGDGTTDSADLSVVIGSFGEAVPAGTSGDVNGDGVVDAADLSVLIGDFGCG